MAVDVNALLDSALANAQVLQNQVKELQAKVDAGTLTPDQEKKIQDLVTLLTPSSK